MIKIYSKGGCPSCKNAKQWLQKRGHEIEEHCAEHHTTYNDENHNWRERIEDYPGVLGQLSKQNDDLPVIYDDKTERYMRWCNDQKAVVYDGE